MNKEELITGAAMRCGQTQKKVRECLNALLCIVSEELTRGSEVRIAEFGRLFCMEKKARKMRIPAGRIIEVPAKTIVRFKAYSHFNHYSTKY